MKGFFLIFFIVSSVWSNSFEKTQQIARNSMKTSKIRLRIGSENMANAESVGYVPKEIVLAPTYDRHKKMAMVRIKKIQKKPAKQKTIFQPSHPLANEEGYVQVPDSNPLIEIMNVQEAKHSYERALKIHETATDLRHKSIGLISGR